MDRPEGASDCAELAAYAYLLINYYTTVLALSNGIDRAYLDARGAHTVMTGDTGRHIPRLDQMEPRLILLAHLIVRLTARQKTGSTTYTFDGIYRNELTHYSPHFSYSERLDHNGLIF
jgi:hypothetical protein